MLDTEHLYKNSWQRAASSLGYVLDDRFYFTLVGRTDEAGEAALAERFAPDFPLAAFRQRWEELWRAEVEVEGIPRKPSLTELLDYLNERKMPVPWLPQAIANMQPSA